ncbi:helix-turn-helix transcriptional regulator [Sphingomonas cavernae]|uniref:AraC family transcriptional regulator n=1 Tax=Sphingomonas cavernae TaxID=2320861 RepID=A0A418WMJ3_9SPHN|nr:AraC family transcriptional regulator [Sphingomonas cavernae]RJF91229.1 AraC family transcriptional regulator [Sphingomonas cavernae]
MAETLFALDKRNYRECQTLFRGQRDQEYYQGDYWIEDASVVDVRAERKPVGPASIILLRSATRLFFRRTRQHIRQDATDLSVLWFVKRGGLVISNQCGNRTAHPGDFVITRSMSPFFIECQPDDAGVHEVLHVTVPTHILRAHIPHDLSTGLFMPMDRRELVIAENMLTDIFRDDGRLGPDTARTLLDTAFTIIGHAVRTDETAMPARQSVTDRRLEDVLRFIEVHLSDPDLSTAMVSKGCGISPRYLSSLLRLRGTTFSELVWEQRLEKAKSWLSSSNPRDISISEIAYGVGFKSAAHFSRMFKRVFEINPREFRGGVGEEIVHADYQRYTESGGLLQ